MKIHTLENSKRLCTIGNIRWLAAQWHKCNFFFIDYSAPLPIRQSINQQTWYNIESIYQNIIWIKGLQNGQCYLLAEHTTINFQVFGGKIKNLVHTSTQNNKEK